MEPPGDRVEREIEFESAEDQLREQREAQRLGRKILTRACVAGVIILVIGIVIGGAGEHHFSSRVPPLTAAQYEAYGSILAHIPDAAAAPCADFTAYAGTAPLPTPSFVLRGVADAFVSLALRLPRTHVGLRQLIPLDTAFRFGVPVNGVWIRRAPRSDARLQAGVRAWPIEAGVTSGQRLTSTELSLCTEADCALHAAMASDDWFEYSGDELTDEAGCDFHLKAIVRAMVGCACCAPGTHAGANCSAPLVVYDYAAVCSKLPLTDADALEAARSHDLEVQSEVATFGIDDLRLVAASTWPSLVTYDRASSTAEDEARSIVTSVWAAAAAMESPLPPATVRIGWPGMPNGLRNRPGPFDGPGELPVHVSLADLIIALRSERSAAHFDNPVDISAALPFSTAVVMERGVMYVPPTLTMLTPALPAYRAGAVAHAIAYAVAPAVHCTGPADATGVGDVAALLLARTGFPVAEDAPTLVASDGVEIGPTQLFYIGAAAAAPAGACRIGYVPDSRYAAALKCSDVHCAGCTC